MIYLASDESAFMVGGEILIDGRHEHDLKLWQLASSRGVPKQPLPAPELSSVICFCPMDLRLALSIALCPACSLVSSSSLPSPLRLQPRMHAASSPPPTRKPRWASRFLRPETNLGPERSACRFRSTQGSALSAKTVTLSVHYSDTDVSGNDTGMAESLKAAGYKNVHQVSGVGDAAIWGTNSMMGRPMGELTVRKGKNLILTIVISGIQDEATALARAKALAATILPKA